MFDYDLDSLDAFEMTLMRHKCKVERPTEDSILMTNKVGEMTLLAHIQKYPGFEGYRVINFAFMGDLNYDGIFESNEKLGRFLADYWDRFIVHGGFVHFSHDLSGAIPFLKKALAGDFNADISPV